MGKKTFDFQGELAGFQKSGTGVGLHRMSWFLDELGAADWLARLDAIKVTGSNGKGSTCAMLASILQHLPLSSGIYTSPHLIHFRERIVLNGEPISDQELSAAWDFVRDRLEDYRAIYPDDAFGAFEIFTATALRYFSTVRPEVIVAEAGIGGRYDSTRVIPGHLVAITSLDLEHTALLGDRLEMIAYDKADLCCDGGTLVVGDGVKDEVLRRLKSYASLRQIRLLPISERCRVKRMSIEGTKMRVDATVGSMIFDSLEIGLAGRHQWSNAVVAILLLQEWIARHHSSLMDELAKAIRAGLSKVSFPGRFQKVQCDPAVYIDVGHTPETARALVDLAKEAIDTPILLVTGVSHDKNAESIVPILLELADGVVCTRAWHKGSDVERIESIVRESSPSLPRWSTETLEEAMALACDEARQRGSAVVVAGGLFLSIEASEVVAGRDPRGLNFF